MGRKSKLTDKQWEEVRQRHIDGESIRSLAEKFKVAESSVREKISGDAKKIKDVANQIVATESALKALPISAQISAHNLASQLRSISEHLAGAALFGSMTAHRLSGIANGQVEKIDDAEPEKSAEALQRIAVLTKIANSSSEIGLNLLKANKDAAPEDDAPTPVAVTFGIKDAKRAVD